MKQKPQNERKFYIYQQRDKRYVEVEERVFREFYRYTKRERYTMQKEGKCACPQSYLLRCDCDCDICPYQMKSSCAFTKEDEVTPIPEWNIPDSDLIEDALNYRRLRELVDMVAEIYPEGRRIILLRYHGLTDSEIEKILGVGRRTFQYRLKSALRKLGIHVEDFR